MSMAHQAPQWLARDAIGRISIPMNRFILTTRDGIRHASMTGLRAAALLLALLALLAANGGARAQEAKPQAVTAPGLQLPPPAPDVMPDAATSATTPEAHGPIPTDWIDPTTGHRVIRLSREDDTASFYFHYNSFPPGGDKIVVTNRWGLATIDLKTLESKQLTFCPSGGAIVGRKTRQVFYVNNNVVMATDIDTRATRVITVIPRSKGRFGGLGLSCDDATIAGCISLGPPTPEELARMREVEAVRADAPKTSGATAMRRRPSPGQRTRIDLGARLSQRRPMEMVAIDVKTGRTRYFDHCTDWLNHVQMSTTDPGLIMFAHEGPWHLVDRPWTIRTDGSGKTPVHIRKMNDEISGHEFFGPDGAIWFDLQTPKSVVFWLARHDVKTGQETWYHLNPEEWSVHFNVSPDGQLMSGDGGGPHSVAAPHNGQWMYLFRPYLFPPETTAPEKPSQVTQVGKLQAERLVNMSKHNYDMLEPNGVFTPDGKWIVFRSNMFGPEHVFAVEVAKAATAQ
jgi:oligogalacturonide lyase